MDFLFVLPDTVVSKMLIPRMQLAEQGNHMSPNKSAKVNRKQEVHYYYYYYSTMVVIHSGIFRFVQTNVTLNVWVIVYLKCVF